MLSRWENDLDRWAQTFRPTETWDVLSWTRSSRLAGGAWSRRPWVINRRLRSSTESPAMYLVRVMSGVAREVRDVVRARTPTHARLRDSLVGIALATIGVDLICAVLALAFEQHANQTQITSFGSALFWTSTQLMTVSSSIQNPISAPAHVLDVAMEVYAITVVASLAGAMGAFLVRRGYELEQGAAKAQH